jgi:hypothetical protein
MRLRLQELLLAVIVTSGFAALEANAQDKHVTTISNCTVIDTPGAYQVGKVITASLRDLISNPAIFIPACIIITADFVNLDLGGNTIIGPGSGLGITSAPNTRSIKVHSGSVTNFDVGVYMDGNSHTVEYVRGVGNRDGGISIGVAEAGHRAFGNVTNNNGFVGLIVTCPSVVVSNVATNNGVFDIQTVGVCTRSDNWPPDLMPSAAQADGTTQAARILPR